MSSFIASHSLFLWLIPLAGLPIVFHLFFKLRKRPLPFPSLLFFRRIDPHMHARRHLRELLALLLRVLAILALLLALARPVWLGTGSGGPITSIILIDNSASMSGPAGGDQTRLKQALTAAAILVAEMREQDSAAVVLLVDDPAVAGSRQLTSNKSLLNAALEQIRETEATGTPSRALACAFDLLSVGIASGCEIHIFTDLQHNEWGKALDDVPKVLVATEIIVHHIVATPLKTANVTIRSLKFPRKRLVAHQPFVVEARCENTGGHNAQVELHWHDDADKQGSRPLLLPAHHSKSVTIMFTPSGAGFHWLCFWIEGDGFAADNRLPVGFWCADTQLVFLAGSEADFGLLPLALDPSHRKTLSGLRLQFVDPVHWPALAKSQKPVALAVTWEQLARMPKCESHFAQFVEQGGNLLLVPEPRFLAPAQLPKWVGFGVGIPEKSSGTAVLVWTPQNPLWDEIKDENNEILLKQVRAYQFYPLQVAAGTKILLGLEDGRALLGYRRQGRGYIFVSGLAFAADWSTLPLKGGAVPLVHNIALFGSGDQHRIVGLTAGNRLHTVYGAGASIHLRSISGSPLDWKGRDNQLPDFPRSGIYLATRGQVPTYIAVRSAPDEGHQQFVDPQAVPALAQFSYRAWPYQGVQRLLQQCRSLRRGLDLYLPLLLAAILILLIESIIVNPGARVRRQEAALTVGLGWPLAQSSGILEWHLQLSPLWCALLAVVTVGCLWHVYRCMLVRVRKVRALLLLVPKILVLALLFVALFDPVRSVEKCRDSKSKVLALVDVSSSMAICDQPGQSRWQRARQAVQQLQRGLPDGAQLKPLEFDIQIHDRPIQSGNGPRRESVETDLAGCLATLGERSDISSYLAAVVISDGGDERVDNIRLPPLPCHFIGIGSDPSRWQDLAISNVDYPRQVEQGTWLTIRTDVVARIGGNHAFRSKLARVAVVLEREQNNRWQQVALRRLDLRNQRARAGFRVNIGTQTGLVRYRLQVEKLAGEIAHSNNRRLFQIAVTKKSLHVLFFSRQLGMGFKMLRHELARDPGISFTALFRVIGERFFLQGRRLAGDERLQAGFADDSKILRPYDCIIIGSFPADSWQDPQARALLNYVRQGGAVVFMGGAESFGAGGYAGSPLATLFPWQINDREGKLLPGRFPITLAPDQPITVGLDNLLTNIARLELASINQVGPLKAGASALLTTAAGQKPMAVVAVQSFGRGKVMGVATDTFWQWARQNANKREFYGRFWRQAMRNLVGQSNQSRLFTVKWDRERYRPGEQAQITVTLNNDGPSQNSRLDATLSTDREKLPVALTAAAEGKGIFIGRMFFKHRGHYLFRLVLYQGENIGDSYEKILAIAPLCTEGSNLELDAEYLQRLAAKTSAVSVHESDITPILTALKNSMPARTIRIELPLVRTGPYFLLLVLAALIGEWLLRRRYNLF